MNQTIVVILIDMEVVDRTMEVKIDEFFDIMDNLKAAYYENFRLRAEITKLKKESQERHDQIMEMARMSGEGLHNWIDAILEGKITIK